MFAAAHCGLRIISKVGKFIDSFCKRQTPIFFLEHDYGHFRFRHNFACLISNACLISEACLISDVSMADTSAPRIFGAHF